VHLLLMTPGWVRRKAVIEDAEFDADAVQM